MFRANLTQQVPPRQFKHAIDRLSGNVFIYFLLIIRYCHLNLVDFGKVWLSRSLKDLIVLNEVAAAIQCKDAMNPPQAELKGSLLFLDQFDTRLEGDGREIIK